MKQIVFFVLVIIWGLSFKTSAQQVEDIRVDALLKRVNQANDTLYVVNFWATWCPPCVEELPVFDSYELKHFEVPVKVLLVSLDFKSQKDKQLRPFLEKMKIAQEVLLLDERNPNEWIDKIDTTWSGAIPATVVYRNRAKTFYEGELDINGLLKLISIYK